VASAATLIVAIVAPVHAYESLLTAQPLLEADLAPGDALQQPASTGDVIFGPQPVPDSAAAPELASYDPLMDDGTPPIPTVRPVNWVSGPYLRGGVNFILGEDLFDLEQDTGWGISGGFRQPLGPEIGGDRFFLDVGGSYQASYGLASPVGIPGTRTTTVSGTVISAEPVVDAFEVSLEEIRRGSAHVALGWFWGPGLDNRSSDPQVRFATRLGGRLGHARGAFSETQLVGPDNILETVTANHYRRTDTYGGLFVGTEAILLQRNYSFGQFQWTVDGEFACDWINFENIADGDLGTAAVMMGFMLSR
jgi:hypothetical protein